MNFFKKIIATLTGMENSFSRDRSGDSRTDLLTRGPAKVESTEEKFRKENEKEAQLAKERQETAKAKKDGEEVDITKELEEFPR